MRAPRTALTLPRALQVGHSTVVAPMHCLHRIGFCEHEKTANDRELENLGK